MSMDSGGDVLDCLFDDSIGYGIEDELQADIPEFSEGLPSFGCLEGFQCLQSCHAKGLICSGLLTRLLQGDDPFPANFHGNTIQLCGQMFVTSTVFSAGCTTPFLLLRQRLNQLLDGGSDSENVPPLFRQCTEFLHFMECFVYRYILSVDRIGAEKFQPSVDRVAMEIADQFPLLLLQLEPLEETLSGLIPGGRGQQALTNQIIHLVLHIYWTIISVLYRLVPIIGTSPFLKQAYSTIQAFLSLAAAEHNKCGSPKERMSLQLFVCPCVLELWLLLLHTLDHLASSGNSTSFWILISQILGEVVFPSRDLSHDPSLDPQETSMEVRGSAAISPADPVGFSWRVLAQLAPLYWYSKEGQLNRSSRTDGSSLPANWVFAQELLPLTFQQGSSEAQLRYRLHCLLLLCQSWAPATGPIAKAWDYFQKHMNDSFHLPGGSIQDYVTSEGSTPRQWLQYVQSLCAGKGDSYSTTAQPERSSFELFLCILPTVLRRGRDQEGQQMWKQLKGRIFSKIHRRWLTDLSSTGLRHLTTLFLVLATVADTCEVGTKMVSNFVSLDLGNPQQSKAALMWRGVFALLLFFEEQRLSMTELIDKLQPALSEMVKVQSQARSSDQHSLWEIVGVVLDGVQEVLEVPEGIHLGAADLIRGYLRGLLERSQAQHLGRMLQFCDGVSSALTAHSQALQREEGLEGAGLVTRNYMHGMEKLKAGCQAFWLHCCLPLLSRAQDPIPAPQISGSAASITAFACECKELLSQKSSASTFFEEFGVNDSASPSLASPYLCHVITNDVIRQQLLCTEHAQLQVAHTWFRCVVLMHNPPTCATHVQELTRLILQLPFISSLIASQTVVSTDVLPVLQQLLRAINTRHSSSPDLRESGLWRERLAFFLGDLPKYMELALSGNTSGEGLKMSYRVASVIVKICPRLLYSKTDSKCLLPRLVDRLVLPLTSSKKPPVQGISLCIRTHLQHFLSGLLQLEPSRDDFIRRKLKQIFSKYFHSYAQPINPLMQSVPNPFMVLLQPYFEPQVTEESSQRLVFILEVIAAQFLVLPQQPPSLLPTLQFLRQTVERIQNQKLLIRCTESILDNMLSCLLACDVCSPQSEPQGIRRQVMGILRPLLQACGSNQDTIPLTPLLSILRDFIASKLEQRQAAVFKSLMAIAELCPLLVREILPTALHVVERYESSRGVGTDSRLRSAYHALAVKVKK